MTNKCRKALVFWKTGCIYASVCLFQREFKHVGISDICRHETLCILDYFIVLRLFDLHFCQNSTKCLKPDYWDHIAYVSAQLPVYFKILLIALDALKALIPGSTSYLLTAFGTQKVYNVSSLLKHLFCVSSARENKKSPLLKTLMSKSVVVCFSLILY